MITATPVNIELSTIKNIRDSCIKTGWTTLAFKQNDLNDRWDDVPCSPVVKQIEQVFRSRIVFRARYVCITRTTLSQHLSRRIGIPDPSVCLSVCLSVACQYCVETVKHSIILFHHPVTTPFKLFHTTPCGNIPTGTPWLGMKKSRFSTNIWLYLGNDTG